MTIASMQPIEATRVLARLAAGEATPEDLALDCESFAEYAQQNLFCILAAFADCGANPDFKSVCILAGRFVREGILVSDGLDKDGEPIGRDEGLDVLTEWVRVREFGRLN